MLTNSIIQTSKFSDEDSEAQRVGRATATGSGCLVHGLLLEGSADLHEGRVKRLNIDAG